MDTVHSKSALAYKQIRRALRLGRYAPGQRLDPAKLAEEFRTSPMPVRLALYRLVGEDLVVNRDRGGMHIPMPTDAVLHDLYDWMKRMLLMACDIGVQPTTRKTAPLKLSSADDNLVDLTWQLFDAIAHMTVHRYLRLAVQQANDRLAPIRRTEHELLEHPFEELSELNRIWQKRDVPALKSALSDYHERRKQLVPCIVDLLNKCCD